MRKAESSGSDCRRRVSTPSVATSSRVSFEKRRSKRTWKPTSWPSVQPLLLGDPPGDRARGHAPRLQHEDRPVGDERRRHARRLPRSGRRHEHQRSRAGQRLAHADELRSRSEEERASAAARRMLTRRRRSSSSWRARAASSSRGARPDPGRHRDRGSGLLYLVRVREPTASLRLASKPVPALVLAGWVAQRNDRAPRPPGVDGARRLGARRRAARGRPLPPRARRLPRRARSLCRRVRRGRAPPPARARSCRSRCGPPRPSGCCDRDSAR